MTADELEKKSITIQCEIPINTTYLVEDLIGRYGSDYDFAEDEVIDFIKMNMDWLWFVETDGTMKLK